MFQQPVFVVNIVRELVCRRHLPVQSETIPAELDLVPVLVQNLVQLSYAVVGVFHARFVRKNLLHNPPESVALEFLHISVLVPVGNGLADAVVSHLKRAQEFLAVHARNPRHKPAPVVGDLRGNAVVVRRFRQAVV